MQYSIATVTQFSTTLANPSLQLQCARISDGTSPPAQGSFAGQVPFFIMVPFSLDLSVRKFPSHEVRLPTAAMFPMGQVHHSIPMHIIHRGLSVISRSATGAWWTSPPHTSSFLFIFSQRSTETTIGTSFGDGLVFYFFTLFVLNVNVSHSGSGLLLFCDCFPLLQTLSIGFFLVLFPRLPPPC